MCIYRISLDESVIRHPSGFSCFNDFFVRALQPGTRPVPTSPLVLSSPCDGKIAQIGRIESGTILQAKGHNFAVQTLIGDQELGQKFEDGSFVILYLSPRDYHRVHAPVACRILQTRYLRGRLLSVRPQVMASVPELFSRNERLVITCETTFGVLGIVMVGALLVSGIRATWRQSGYGLGGETIEPETFETPPEFMTGEEMARFEFGSTVILLLPPNTVTLNDQLGPETALLYGEPLGQITDNKAREGIFSEHKI